jgi:hypothetical protein
MSIPVRVAGPRESCLWTPSASIGAKDAATLSFEVRISSALSTSERIMWAVVYLYIKSRSNTRLLVLGREGEEEAASNGLFGRLNECSSILDFSSVGFLPLMMYVKLMPCLLWSQQWILVI